MWVRSSHWTSLLFELSSGPAAQSRHHLRTVQYFRRQLKGHLFQQTWTRRSVTSDMLHLTKTPTYLVTNLHVLVQFVSVCVLEDEVCICSDTLPSAATVNSLRRWARAHSCYLHCLFSLSAWTVLYRWVMRTAFDLQVVLLWQGLKVLPGEDSWRTSPTVKSP